MVTRDGVPHDKRLAGSITVTVEKVRTNPKPRRDAELTVRDEDGAELTVVIWETHEINQSWDEGATYELTGARGKRYSARGATTVEVQSTKAFSAQQVTTNDATRILVLGDTHVGYRHRPRSDKPAWAKDVSGRDAFVRCLKRARDADIDGVIHAGDIFDHHNTKGDRNRVGQEITRTIESDIAFYYVFGNHDDKKGRDVLRSTSGIHLAGNTSRIGKHLVKLQGVDHAGSTFPTSAPTARVQIDRGPNILVIHETPHPVIDESGTLVYQNDVNRADISRYIETAGYDIDLIITGHLHVANQLTLKDTEIPVLVTGPTIPISTYEEDSRPSTWLLTVAEDGFKVTRQPL